MEVNIIKELIFLEQLLEYTVRVSINTKCIGVVLPDYLYKQDSCSLDFGFGMAVPIRDLRVTRHGIRATVSFNRQPFMVQVPWYSVYQLTNMNTNEWYGWPDDAPKGTPQQQPTGMSKEDGPEPTTVQELVAGTGAEPKDNVMHVDFASRKRQAKLDVPVYVDDNEKEPA